MVPAVNSVLGLVLLVLLSCAGPREGHGPTDSRYVRGRADWLRASCMRSSPECVAGRRVRVMKLPGTSFAGEGGDVGEGSTEVLMAVEMLEWL
jgi:hypothetical protein